MTGIVYDDAYLTHGDPHHPENADRLRAAVSHLREIGLWDQARHIPARPAMREEALWLHTADYLEELELISRRGGGSLDADTYATRETYQVALLAAGGCLAAVEAVFAREVTNALCLVRPPGHHALSGRGMGFCFLNNVALAAECAIRRAHLDRVTIVDWDVHHGNGTQDIFYSRSDVQYISIHQGALYPGTGSVDEVGIDAGAGSTTNIMLPPGAEDRHYLQAFEDLVIPLIGAFDADMILVSAGFDTHVNEPLARMCMTNMGYHGMAKLLVDVAGELCAGRLLVTLEGGYDREAMAGGSEAVCRALMGLEPPEPEAMPVTIHQTVTDQVDDWLEQNIALHSQRLGL